MAKLTVSRPAASVHLELSQEEAEILTAILGGLAGGDLCLEPLFSDLDDEFSEATDHYRLLWEGKVPHVERREP